MQRTRVAMAELKNRAGVLPGHSPVRKLLVKKVLRCQGGSWTGSLSSTWELVRNAISLVPPQPLLNQNLWGWGQGVYVLTLSLGYSCTLKFEKH